MSIFDNIESKISTGIDHLKGLLTHDDVFQHVIDGIEGLDTILEKPAVQAIADSLFPAAIPAFKALNAVNALGKAIEAGQAGGIAGAVSEAAQAAGEIAPAPAQGIIAEIGKAAEVVTEVSGAATPDAASSAVEAAKRFAAVSGISDIQLTHPDPLEGMPGSSN